MKLAAIHNAQKTTSIDDRIMPLINIVFLLLIFFLVAGVIKDVEPVDVDPPASVAEAESDEADLTIFIAQNGQLALGNQLLDEDDFTAQLNAAISAQPDQSVRIVADKEIAFP